MTKADPQVETKAAAPGISALEMFKQKKKDQSFDVTKPLPKSGIDVTYPNFISHNDSMAVMAKAGVTASSAKKSAEGKRKLIAFAAATFCTFGPNKEKLSFSDIGELFDKEDTAFLAGPLLGEDDDEGGDLDLGKA